MELADGSQGWCNGWYLRAKDDALEAQRDEEYLSEKTSSETFVPIDGEPVYTCTATRLNCRAEPNTKATILHQITMLTEVNVLGQDGDFYLCRLDDGGIVYCSVNYLTEGATYAEYDGAVDLRVYLPDAKFELLFASPNNITGSAMYPAVPLMEEKTAEMLKQAFEIFQNDGYTLKVYDAYRPRSAQVKLYDIVQNNKFIANPYTGGSWHQRGRAIDMSLIDNATGLELEMPTPMHTFDDSAARYSRDSWTEEARKNVDYMTSVMESVGFGIIQTEWWHFENNSGPGSYLPDEIDFTSLTYKPVSEYQVS